MRYLISFPIVQTRKSEQLIILITDLRCRVREAGRLHLSSHFQKHHFTSLRVSVASPSLGPLRFRLPCSGAGPSPFSISAAAGSIWSSLQVAGRKRKAYTFTVLGKMHRTWWPRGAGEVQKVWCLSSRLAMRKTETGDGVEKRR